MMEQSDTISVGRLTKEAMAGYTLFFVLLLPCVIAPEAVSLIVMVVFAAWVMISQLRIKRGLLLLVAPFILLMLIGALGAAQHSLYDIIKDVWYIGKVIVALGVGYIISRYIRDVSQVYRIVLIVASIASAVHIIEVAIKFQSVGSMLELRMTEGVHGYFITVIGLAFLVAIPRRGIRKATGRGLLYLTGILGIVSLFATFSRTYILSLIVMLVVLKGWSRFKVKNVIIVTIVIGVLMGALLFMAGSEVSGDKTFVQKTLTSTSEMVVKNYKLESDINAHWRGYETYRALMSFSEGSAFQKVFGKGLGSSLDLGFTMQVGSTMQRYIPVFHNGFIYVLFKCGILGLIVYLYFLFKLIRLGPLCEGSSPDHVEQRYMQRILSGMGWSLLFTSILIAGAFNKSTMFPVLILIGLFTAMLERNKRELA